VAQGEESLSAAGSAALASGFEISSSVLISKSVFVLISLRFRFIRKGLKCVPGSRFSGLGVSRRWWMGYTRRRWTPGRDQSYLLAAYWQTGQNRGRPRPRVSPTPL